MGEEIHFKEKTIMFIRKIINKLFHLRRGLLGKWYKFFNPIKFRLLGAKLGENSCMRNKVYFQVEDGAEVVIGSYFAVNSGDNINPLCGNNNTSIFVDKNAKLTIGDKSGISGGCIWVTDSITIGNYVNIGANCIIMDGDVHNTDWQMRRKDRVPNANIPYKKSPIVIEDDVWLGCNVQVLKGVHIGARSVIGAGSIVTQNIPSDCIAVGNPCKIVKRMS